MDLNYRKYYEKIKNSKFVKDVSFVFVANLISNGINFIAFLIIAKVLSNDDFGKLAVIMAIITGISDISNLGMNATTIRYTAIFKSKNDIKSINTLLSTVLANILGISLLVIIVFIFISKMLSGFLFKDAGYYNFLLLSSFGIGIALLYSFVGAVFQGLQQFKSYFYFTVILSVFKILFIVAIFYFDVFNLFNVFLIISFTPVFSILASKFWLRKYKINPLLYKRSMVKETFTFSKWIFLWSICAILQSRVSTYLLASLTTMTEVSFYDMSKKLTNIIMFGLSSYSSVLNTRLASITEKIELMDKVKKSKYVTIIISLVLAISIFLFPFVLKLFFGTKYDGAIIPLGIILFGLIFFVWTFPYNSGLYSLGKSKVFFYQALIGFALESALAFLLIPSYGAVGASISFVITYCVVMVISMVYFKKFIKEAV